MSSVSDVRGIGAQITLRPCRCNGRMTLFQQEPSAHAPCTKMMAEPLGKAFISNPCFFCSGAQIFGKDGFFSEVADQVKGHSQRYYILEKEQAKKAHVPHNVNPGHGNNR